MNSPSVLPLTVSDYDAMRRRGDAHELFDVRTPHERAIASIEGSTLLDRAGQQRLLALPRETTLVFQCHHGVRSHSAALWAIEQGFSRVYNLLGGIEAWSIEIDPDVPRY